MRNQPSSRDATRQQVRIGAVPYYSDTDAPLVLTEWVYTRANQHDENLIA
jgi:hypothetical protein